MLNHYFSQIIDATAKLLLKLRNRHFLVLDIAILLITPAIAVMLRTERMDVLDAFGVGLIEVTLVFLLVKLLVFYAAGLYNRYWQYASIDELAKITLAVLTATLIQALLLFMVLRPFIPGLEDFPRSVPFLDGLVVLLLVGGTRYSVRLARRLRQRVNVNGKGRRVLIMGAGEAGVMIVEEMRSNPQLGLHPIGFLDDNKDKLGVRIRGLKVLGNRDDIPDLVEEMNANLVIIAIPTAAGNVVRDIAEVCKKIGVKTKTIPGIYELLDGRASIGSLRDVQVEDLLRRPPVQIDMNKVEALLNGARVLVTGGGGSIGSELCRQILGLQPAEILLLGHGENSIFKIEGELRRRIRENVDLQGHTQVRSVIADVRDHERLEQVFDRFRPQVVFHAAAHKHVPLMESNVEEAVTNNVMGTRNVLACATAYEVERFILISTDKAVNPTSIMGATKRIAELLVRDTALRTGRPFVAVRFGNVLGSRGSVLEIFRDQITRGGPLTVTHPDIKRYFMTIPEAVHLVLQAAVMGKGGEVFLLDMGEPMRIVDLARDLIRLSGMEEGRDIDIEFTGLRPGEKLFEELAADGETFVGTSHEKVMVCAEYEGDVLPTDELHWRITQMVETAKEGKAISLVQHIADLVPDYRESKRLVLLEQLELALVEAEIRAQNAPVEPRV